MSDEVWPTADEIARAVWEACKVVGGDADPIEVFLGSAMPDAYYARAYAFLALAHEFPEISRRPLARKVGNAGCASATRSSLLKAHGSPWFEIASLNVVRQACGWSKMSLREATDAPLVLCGRASESSDRSIDEGSAPESSAASVDAGPARDKAPATFSPRIEAVLDARGAVIPNLEIQHRRDGSIRVVPVKPPVETATVDLPALPLRVPAPPPVVKPLDLPPAPRVPPVVVSNAANAVAQASAAIMARKAAKGDAMTRARERALAAIRATVGKVDVAPVLLGDPPPGRSALDQRKGEG